MNTLIPLQLATLNEIVRLLWTSYKEAYFKDGSKVYFNIIDSKGNSKLINSLETAQEVLYIGFNSSEYRIVGNLNDHLIEIKDASQLLNILKPYLIETFTESEFSEERWENFLNVSKQSINNEAEAIRNKLLLDEGISQYQSTVDYAQSLTRNESYNFFNRYASFSGRYDMPFSKMRLPINNVSSTFYAPESGNIIPVILTALNKKYSIVRTTDNIDNNSIFKKEFPESYTLWLNMLKARNKDESNYIVFPIHPLSIELFSDKLSDLIKSEDFFWDKNAVINTQGSLSYRTMSSITNANVSIKLPVPLQMTGYIRFIDTEEIEIGAELSKYLQTIFDIEKNFSNRIFLDRDILSACVTMEPDVDNVTKESQYLSFLLRESQTRFLQKGELTMPMASLFSKNSISQKHFLVEIMEKAGVESQAQAMEYFRHYSELIMSTVLTLYIRYGIMLEAHQENLGLTINESCQITKLHYHDIPHAIFIYKPLFTKSCGENPIINSLPFVSDDIEPSCSQFIHTVLILNMLPTIEVITNRYQIQKSELYSLLASIIKDTLNREKIFLDKQNEGRKEAALNLIKQIELQILNSETYLVKRLLGRLYVQSQTKHWGEVPNNDESYLSIKGTRTAVKNILYGK